MKKISRFFDWLYIFLLKRIRPYDKQGMPLRQRRRRIRREVLSYYQNQTIDDPFVKEAISYLRHRPDAVFFPAFFRDKYEYRQIHLQLDSDGVPYWLMTPEKKLYFLPGKLNEVAMSINSLRIEQDEHSPHRYITPGFQIEEGDILADVGCAEAFLSLQYIEKVKHVYLFERDPIWINVLQKTFAPWKDKVTIVPKYVSDHDDDNNVRLDTYFTKEGVCPDFIKLDVEGVECKVLNGMKTLFDTEKPMKIAACTYHYHDEYRDVIDLVSRYGFRYETSDGWMLFGLYDEMRPPYFRHGMVRIWANS